MKPGIRIGQTYAFEVVVTDEMRARFGDITVHRLYSTASMLTHMEWASRQHILPVLEDGEEGAGYHMDIDHLVPVAIGETVRISSMVTGIKPDRIVCRCEAFHGDQKIGRATVVQAILPLSKLRARIP
jgi:fluoroacetyl-CoA thioesterase